MIQVNDLTISFEGKSVLKNANMTVNKGEVTAIVGRNGSGKTVLLKSLAGFRRPTKGKIMIGNTDIYIDTEKFLNIGVLIESPEFMPHKTGFDNLKMLANIRKVADDSKIIELMNYFELPNDKKVVKKYSLGMRQKLGIIQAIMEDQDIIFLDEPTNSLDVKMADKFKSLINELKAKGKTIVMISHIEEDITPVADVIYTIEAGRVNKLGENKS